LHVNDKIVKFASTHMQHSEEPAYFDHVRGKSEQTARKAQAELVLEKVEKDKSPYQVVTGDLNLNDEEYATSCLATKFQEGARNYHGEYTWGGDEICTILVGDKQISPPSNLDHTMGTSNLTITTR